MHRRPIRIARCLDDPLDTDATVEAFLDLRPFLRSSRADTPYGTAGTRTRTCRHTPARTVSRSGHWCRRACAGSPNRAVQSSQMSCSRKVSWPSAKSICAVSFCLRLPFSCHSAAILALTCSARERIQDTAREQAAQQLDRLGGSAGLGAFLVQLFVELLDLGFRLLAGLALDLGGRLGMLGPALGSLRSTSSLRLPIFAALPPLSRVQSSGCHSMRFASPRTICRLRNAVLVVQSLIMCLRTRAGLIAKVVPYAACSRRCDKWRFMVAYPKH